MSETPTPRMDLACDNLDDCLDWEQVAYRVAAQGQELERELTAERAALQAAQEELREDSAIRERMASLLSATAIALKGQEGELQRHGWHDLPDIALKIKLACDISEAMLQDERAARERAEAELKENEAVINVWRGRTQRAEAERDALAEALREIRDPIGYMKRRLKPGQVLAPITAVQLARDPEYLRGIARAALAALERGDGKEAGRG